MKKLALLVLLIVHSVLLSGCLPAIQSISSVSSIISVNNDRRSAGVILDDKTTYLQLAAWAAKDPKLDDAHLNFLIYNKAVLITGEAPNKALRAYISKQAKLQSPAIKQVFNEVSVRSSSGLLKRAKDSAITLQVEAMFQNQEVFHPTHVRVMTEAQTVYLMGAVTKREADKAVKIVTKAKGIKQVVRLFDYLKTRPAVEIKRDKLQVTESIKKAKLKQQKADLEAEKAKIQEKINQLTGTTGTSF
ncbi:MAG: BON domain-containing protein [Candidatus Thioglobus sp.]|nr:MAG: BON domain-containing protein [Candidatus Thioglobus sp.]RUM84042.1 MAG: BON domain-containing protein [Candidatus Thioglobus sp.]RUM85355.1 MAG: BON domain-containing protein [Candidatus Thioglobus sp.]